MEFVNIDLNVKYDCFMARENFEENFNCLGEYKKANLYQYIDYGNFKEISIDDLSSIDRKKTLKKSLLNYALSIDWCYYTKTEIRKFNKVDLADFIENYISEMDLDLDELIEITNEYDITIGVDDFYFYETRGYSQGDFSRWCIRKSDLEKFENGNETLPPYIDNLFWDCPITCRITVNEEDYYIDEHISNLYEYNKDEIYKICEELFNNHKEKKHILKYVKENLPNQLEA